MRKLDLGHKWLTENDVFIIAEIGSNHMGDPDLCEQLIIEAAKSGADAVKLQKRNNAFLFTKTGYGQPYQNELSYAPTYGEHRDYLDWFGKYEFVRFRSIADKYGVMLFATPFEEESAFFLHNMNFPIFKISSFDVTNIPMVREIAAYGKPMIISTGGANLADIRRLTDAIDPINDNYALLHCVSVYPNTDEILNLDAIKILLVAYPDKMIGFSSHHPGVLPLTIARTLGATIFEVHFTLNRGSRGTDHGFSMEPRGLEIICQDLRRVTVMRGEAKKTVCPMEIKALNKMSKGIYLNKPLRAGSVVKDIDIVIKAPAGEGMKPYERDDVIGRVLLNDVSTGEGVKREWLK